MSDVPIERILIVEDEPNVRLVFRTALASETARSPRRTTASSALVVLRGNAADLILLDLNLPGMGGMEVLRRLGEEGDRTPVVVVTANGSITVAVEAMKLGAARLPREARDPDRVASRRRCGTLPGSGRESPSRPNRLRHSGSEPASLEDGDLAKAEALVDGLAALESDSARGAPAGG